MNFAIHSALAVSRSSAAVTPRSPHCACFLSPDVFDISLSDSCLQENEDTTTENGINPELAKVGEADAASFSKMILCCYFITLNVIIIHGRRI